MEGNRRWLGWIAIGVSGLALLVALFGRGLGPLAAAAGPYGANAPQAYAQQGAGPQNGGPAMPRGDARRGAERPAGVGAQQSVPAIPRADAGRGAERQRDGGFGLGGWLGFPLRAIGGLSKIGMLALLVVLGLWLIRGRAAGSAAGAARAEPAPSPAQEPREPSGESPTGESYDRE
jgi:hypothetical protein